MGSSKSSDRGGGGGGSSNGSQAMDTGDTRESAACREQDLVVVV